MPTATTKVLIRAPQAPERLAAARMTGRYLMTMQPDAHREVSAKLNKAGLKPAPPLPRAAMSAKPMPDGTCQILRNVGVVLVDPKPEQEDTLHRLAAQERAVVALIVQVIICAAGEMPWMRLPESYSSKSVPCLQFQPRRPRPRPLGV